MEFPIGRFFIKFYKHPTKNYEKTVAKYKEVYTKYVKNICEWRIKKEN